VGATGLHLSHGERSTLDAFQNAARLVGKKPVGALVPFHAFYPAVEGFLETSVRRQIDLAGDNHSLKPFDSTVLKILFLIRYVDQQLPGNVDNLVTLCVDQIDADKLAIRKQVEESLARLESETLISRDGDRYFFLTNEEQDIGREIKTVEIPSGAVAREMGRLLFDDILGETRKHTFSATGRDFSFTRSCDGHVMPNPSGELEVVIVSPLGDSYAELCEDLQACLHSGQGSGKVLIRLPEASKLNEEIRLLLQTESFVKTKGGSALPTSTERILRERQEENRKRRVRLGDTLRALLADASYFVSGTKHDMKSGQPKENLAKALEYLIGNAYPKMGYVEHLHPNIKAEIQSTLRANNVEQMAAAMDAPETNPKALQEVQEYLRLCDQTNQQVVLFDLAEKKYGERPYGWPQLEVVLLVARLAAMRKIDLIVNSAVLAPEKAYDDVTSTNKQRKVWLKPRRSASGDLLKHAKELGKELFGKQGPEDELGLFEFLQQNLSVWNGQLVKDEVSAREGYPGLKEIQGFLETLKKFVKESESLKFLNRFVECKSDLLELAEESRDIREFYANHKPLWKSLHHEVDAFHQNELQLSAHPQAGPALARMKEILHHPKPYAMLKEVAGLQHTVQSANNQLVTEAQEPAVTEIQKRLASLKAELEKAGASNSFLSKVNEEFSKLLSRASSSRSIAHIHQARVAAEQASDQALTEMEKVIATPKVVAETVSGGTEAIAVVPTPKIKKRRLVEAKTLCQSEFIETAEQMEAFLMALREELQATLDAGERAQLK
jgi:hypothetical protein